MEIGSAFSVSQSAMAEDSARMNKLAHNIANNTDADVDTLVEDITQMGIIKNNYEANAKVISTMDDLLENILGMV